MMEIGPMTQAEWPWVADRSLATGWTQVAPSLRDTTSQQAVTKNLQEMLRQALSQPGAMVLVAREGGAPAGYLMVTVMPDDLTQQPAGLFMDIWVEPQWRGRGVSSALTRAGEDYCRSIGLKLVRRWVAAHNAASLRHAQADGCQLERVVFIKPL